MRIVSLFMFMFLLANIVCVCVSVFFFFPSCLLEGGLMYLVQGLEIKRCEYMLVYFSSVIPLFLIISVIMGLINYLNAVISRHLMLLKGLLYSLWLYNELVLGFISKSLLAFFFIFNNALLFFQASMLLNDV